MLHDIKIYPRYFKEESSELKNFELRVDDRSYSVGDILCLHEWDPYRKHYTGRSIYRLITYKLGGTDAEIFGLKKGYCVLSIRSLDKELLS